MSPCIAGSTPCGFWVEGEGLGYCGDREGQVRFASEQGGGDFGGEMVHEGGREPCG